MAVDINALWDFGNPALSEARFRKAMEGASAEDRFILQTQIARTFGLRGDFGAAREVLDEIRMHLATTSSEASTRYWLEVGRAHCSAAHDAESQTEEARRVAREAYGRAFEHAQAGGHDGLAVDALHMMTTVDPSPEAQIEWNLKALAYMESSSKLEAKRWEGSLRNNLGCALHLAGRYEEALVEFERSRIVRQEAGNEEGERVARWMIAWTLRTMMRTEQALAMQLGLEKEMAEAGLTDRYVVEELEHLYRAMGDDEKADHYRERNTVRN